MALSMTVLRTIRVVEPAHRRVAGDGERFSMIGYIPLRAQDGHRGGVSR
jgi:hypothetical protein